MLETPPQKKTTKNDPPPIMVLQFLSQTGKLLCWLLYSNLICLLKTMELLLKQC